MHEQIIQQLFINPNAIVCGYLLRSSLELAIE